MKKIKIYFLILIILLLTGCGDETVNNNDSQSSNNKLLRKVSVSNLESTGITSKYYKSESTSCPGFEHDIIYSDDKYFVSNEKGIYKKYEYNLNMKYSNGTNCKLVYEYPKKVLYIARRGSHKCFWYGVHDVFTIFSDYSYIPFDVKKYDDSTDILDISYTCDSDWAYPYTIKNPFRPLYGVQYKDYNDGGIFKTHSSISYLVIEEDRIYNAHGIIGHVNFNRNMVYLDFKDVDEKIEKALDGIVFTNKAVYMPGIVDYSCYEYADRICKNGYKKNEELSKLMDDIVFINESYVVFKDGTTYSMWDPKEFGEEEIW